ncbi:hypothetical protein PTSG_02964 [Salpingoeca rosetta]|uniref:Uncharacterized protein n=1 Tax=Salpingoeca rosetta (strain ATCC 50818 / BSB-021) TaxID=946362 RepID=F2U3V2_SALR5|nr:uncharacterized protein PTSG_02964 [Salpingoeca rosetta]EGD82296.1 hypothetical protein PTSG_02964 [Salpingoeca rosetta]|eukprot:XP_004996479.1 hypothetical protein PTSG_02964 [Salpingoeca rosetta]
MNTAGRQESSNLASSARNEAREDMAVSAVPSNTVICSLEQDFFTNSAAFSQTMQLMSRAEGCGELNDIIISEEECKIKFIYEKQEDAVKARLKLHGFVFHGHEIDTDFGQAFDVNPPQMSYLKVPEPTKQFLISPPASPPIGWEPGTESPPGTPHECACMCVCS